MEIIRRCSDVLRSYFGVTSLRIYKNMNDFLRKQIEKDGILISL